MHRLFGHVRAGGCWRKMPFAASRFRVLYSSSREWGSDGLSIHKSMHGTLFSWNFRGMGQGEIVPMYHTSMCD